jgi:hypothetical protein
MKWSTLLLINIYILLTFNINAAVPDDQKFIPLGENSLNGKISTQIRGLGGYHEWCIEMTFQNLTSETLYLKLEAGRRLVAVESKFQDILIIKEQRITLLPNGKETIRGYGFCCEATDGAPIKDCVFELGYMAPESWLKVVGILNKHKYGVYQIQAAVWSVSNGYSVNSIGSDAFAPIKELKKAVIEANPKSNTPAVSYNPATYSAPRPMTAQDSIEMLNRIELDLQNRSNWHPIGKKDVYKYGYSEIRKNNQWKPCKGNMELNGRYIILTDSLDNRNNLKLLMGEVKRDTIDFGQGRLLVNDRIVVDRVDVNNDRNHYMFIMTHDVESDIYSIIMTGWNSPVQMFNIRVKP